VDGGPKIYVSLQLDGAVITSLLMKVLVRPLAKEVHCLFDVVWGVASNIFRENAAFLLP